MALATFGAVLNFALQLEEGSLKFYETLSRESIDNQAKQLIYRMTKASGNRINILKRLRSENVTEMILEPIYGINGEDYQIPIKKSSDWELGSVQEIIRKIEIIHASFYQSASEKVSFLSEVAYTFEDFSEEIKDNLKNMK
jgi:hypothetical protein